MKQFISLSLRWLLLVLFVLNSKILSQETDAEKNKDSELKPAYTGSRSYNYTLSKSSGTAAVGLAKYLRYAIHDGNLITGGMINSGLMAYHYVGGSPFLSWPKGTKQVQYLHGAVFYVASEVKDEKGNTIHIVSDNYRRGGETSLDQSHFYGFMPLPKYFNNHQPNSQDWDIGGIAEDVGIDGIPNTNDFGEDDGVLQTQEDFNKDGLLDNSLLNSVGWYAISHRKETWPEYWPQGSYPGDTRLAGVDKPDIRAGKWNGEYGAYIRADQESYYVMDDRENDEFEYFPFSDPATRKAWPNGKRGLGLKVAVRNYQWSARLAEDILISIYDITNEGKDLDKSVVGMYVDPDLGGSLGGDDAAFDEKDDITYSWTKTGLSSNGLPIGYFGFAFLESPGLATDGVDNDSDGLVDESQNNNKDDDNDWVRWNDQNANGTWDNEDKNFNGTLDFDEDLNSNGRLDYEPLNDDIGSDGIGPDQEDYFGPDPDGTEANGKSDLGEPNFEFTDNDESDQVGLTSFYLRDVDNTMANDEQYWNLEITPGVFNVRPGYQRDIAWSYGSGYVKFSGQEKTHKYAIAFLFGNDEPDILRNKKTMQVIYDEDYNFTKAPRKPQLTAIGGNKKVYLQWDDRAEKSKDPIYGNDFEAYYIYKSTDPTFGDIKTITDAFGNPFLFKPLAIYDIKNGLTGIHPVRIGSELGTSSDLGVSYNMGNDSGIKHFFEDSDVVNGRTYYYAVVSVDRGYHSSFYPKYTDREGLLSISPTECTSIIQTDLLGRAIQTDVNTAVVVPFEYSAGWNEPKVSGNIVHATGNGTGSIDVEVVNPLQVVPNNKYKVKFLDDGSHEAYSTKYTGVTSSVAVVDVTNNVTLGALTNLSDATAKEEFVNHGIRIKITNETTKIDTAYWKTGNSNLVLKSTTVEDFGKVIPRDYEIRIVAKGAASAVNNNNLPTNFEVWDVTNPDSSFKVRYRYVNTNEQADLVGVLSDGDKIQLVSDFSTTTRLWIFQVNFPSTLTTEQKVNPNVGDIITIKTKKSFDRNDTFEFAMIGNDTNNEKLKSDLDNIYTVPDPYVAVSTLERKVINDTEGRGDRRIDFVNLPNSCKISIFTVSGQLVRNIDHQTTSNKSRAIWDLRTNDGLEISHGVYLWVVEVPGVGKKLGRLAVIK